MCERENENDVRLEDRDKSKFDTEKVPWLSELDLVSPRSLSQAQEFLKIIARPPTWSMHQAPTLNWGMGEQKHCHLQMTDEVCLTK
jgi:hypothetical protein